MDNFATVEFPILVNFEKIHVIVLQ